MNCRIGRAGAGGLMLSLGAAAPALAAGEHYDTAIGFALALFFFLGFLLYIVPAVVAWDRQHPQVRWIWALTLLLGWTGIGWLLALIWALQSTDNRLRATPGVLASRSNASHAQSFEAHHPARASSESGGLGADRQPG